jgi:hypothetical protein
MNNYPIKGFVVDYEIDEPPPWSNLPEDTIIIGDQMNSTRLDDYFKNNFFFSLDWKYNDLRFANHIKEIWLDKYTIIYPDYVSFFHPSDIEELVEIYKEIYPEIFVI